ncbi:hypothetical protein M569_12105, partial [Genlisea aurea]
RFSLRKRRSRALLSLCRCSAVEQGLKPRPMPKRPTVEEESDFGINFEEIPSKSSNSEAGICRHIENLVVCRRYKEALELFEILEHDRYADIQIDTYDALITACIESGSIRGVKRLTNRALKSGIDFNVYMMNRLLSMHVMCGMMIDARQLFDEMPERNLYSWTIMIGGLVEFGDFVDAFRVFSLMLEEKVVCIGSRTVAVMMIKASSSLSLISPGEQLHAFAFKMGFGDDDVFVLCSLIDMYSKCGNLRNARLVFDAMPEKTTVGWNSIIAGYALHGFSEEALSMYHEMQDRGVRMDHFTYSIVIRVCTRLASLEHGRQAHAGLVRNGFGSDMVANTALVDFYGKWGRIEEARNIFENMPRKNVLSWNALIFGYGTRGRGTEAVELFERMAAAEERIAPNHVTFLAVLSACCSSGMYDRGWQVFESMSRDYGQKPRAMHYACMVELLGREGLLDEAYALIKDAPFVPSVNMWAALLTACRMHENFELGKLAAEKLYGMEPEKLSNYVVLLNIYNAAGKAEESARVLRTLRKKGLKMTPVCTWIEIKRIQHCFVTDDRSHPAAAAIYDELNETATRIRAAAATGRNSKNLLPDVDEGEASMEARHSEKLAVAFGTISTPGSTPLQLVQSHRMCSDCHDAMKSISSIRRREIVFRDGSRFHRFKDGHCSCKDYW